MIVRPFSWETDWEALDSWYKAHGWPDMDPLMFPETGMFVEGLACGWLYKTDSPIGWLEWLVINPEANKVSAFRALKMIYDEADEKAKALGMSSLFSTFNNDALIKLSKSKGYVAADTNVTNLIKVL